jgi:hypothetical protein
MESPELHAGSGRARIIRPPPVILSASEESLQRGSQRCHGWKQDARRPWPDASHGWGLRDSSLALRMTWMTAAHQMHPLASRSRAGGQNLVFDVLRMT